MNHYKSWRRLPGDDCTMEGKPVDQGLEHEY